MSQPRADLLELLTELSFQRRPVVLSSGLESDFYVDCKQTLLHPDGMALTGTVLVDTWQRMDVDIDAVGGPTLGADPMTCAFVLQARRRGIHLPGFFVRKEAKGHGTRAWVEGVKSMVEGSRVLVFEDVHWMDDSSWKLLTEVMREVKPLLVLLTYRSQGGDAPADLSAPDRLGRAKRLDDAQGRYTEYVKQTFPRGLRLDGPPLGQWPRLRPLPRLQGPGGHTVHCSVGPHAHALW